MTEKDNKKADSGKTLLRILTYLLRHKAGMTLALEELPDLVSKGDEPQEEVERKELEETIRKFLSDCTKTQRDVFLRRYFFFESTEEIAARYAMRESNVLNLLSRIRKKLKEHLRKEGYLP